MFLTIILIAGAVLAVRFLGGSKTAQGAIACIGLTFVVLVQITLPAGNNLRAATGGSVWNWLILVAVLAGIVTYFMLLKRLKTRAETQHQPSDKSRPAKMTSGELERYARHIVLREVGGQGQQKLRKSRVLVVGAGGLGSPVLMYLGAAGVGTIGVIDDDIVSLSNLQRQVLFRDQDIDTPKVFAAQSAITAQNPYVTTLPFNRRLDSEIATQLFADFDLILDGTDNFETRMLVNAACVQTKTPLISGAISQWEGQISLFDPTNGGPCYSCIFPTEPRDGLAPSCAEAGVMGALPGIIGSMMASEAIKFITGAGQSLRSEMLIFDALYGESRKIKIEKRANCTVCGDK